MNKIKIHITNNRILYRMIALYTLVSTFIILVLTTVMYSVFSKELKNQIYRFQEQSLKQIANTVSFRAEYANSLMLKVQQDSLMSKLFYTTDEEVIVDAINNVREYRNNIKHLHSVYIYNEQTDTIYYSGENMLDAINAKDAFTDKGFTNILENIEEYPKYTPFLRRLSVEKANGKTYETYVYTYLLYDTYVSGSVKNIVAFNFCLGWMKDALNYISAETGIAENIWIVNNDRQIIHSNTGELIGVTCDNELLPDEIYENESGYHILGKGKDKQMLVYANPSQMGYEDWTFISWNDYSTLMDPLNRARGFIYLACAITFLASLFLISRFARMLYEPVRVTMDRVESLEKEQEKKRKIDKVLFLRKLFLGNVEDDIEVIEEYFAKHRINGETEGDIRMLLISIDYLNSYLRKFGNELEEIDETVEELIVSSFVKIYPKLLCVKMQSGMWAISLPVQDGEADPAALFEELNQVLDEKLSITISMIISGVGHSARDIPYLYSEALNIHSYRYIWGYNRLITSEDIKTQGQEKFEYPGEIEKKLLNSLFNGKYVEAVDAYEEFVREIRWYTIEEIKLSFMLLAYAIKNASVKTMAETSSILLEFDKFYKKLQMVETIDEVHQMFKNLFGEITDKLKVYSKERHEVLIDQIKDYVKANYGNISLSMNQVSDHVNMSSAYLGRLFKQVTGNTFTEYLTKFRLNIACTLLRDTNMTVNEISDEIGFTNSSYFYIIFKKNLDCTPNQYRKQYGNNNIEE